MKRKLRFCCVTFFPQTRTSVHRFDVDVPSCFSSCEVASDAFRPNAEDVRRKAKFQAPATGLALDNGALSALHREKKKADHTPLRAGSTNRGLADMLDVLSGVKPGRREQGARSM